jgi:anion-transporting  ArsA/GET3 family ATPase
VTPRVIVCCGVGGAGKTTAAAAIGLALAQQGQRAVVLTIDPARRLADALGLEHLGNQPRPVKADASGTLHALMLDRKATFDELVRKHSADPETGRRLLANPYYAAVSTRLTGSHEYMACEKLQQLAEAGEWDAIVLDTPPAQHAIDFFRAPERVRRVFEQGVLAALVNPGRGIVGTATRQGLKVMERIAGESVLQDIAEFFRLVQGLAGALRERNQAVYQLLRSDRTVLHLVTQPYAGAPADVAAFREMLREEDLRLDGLIVNRVVLPPRLSRPLDASRLPPMPAELSAALLALPARVDANARAHAAAVSRLSAAAGGVPVASLPELPGGVRSLEGLAELVPYLPSV